MSFDEVAYRLTWEVDHFERLGLDWTYDIEIVAYSGYERYAISDPEPFAHPDPVVFLGYPPVVRHIDFPYTDNGWHVMSRPMYAVLRGVGPFPHRTVPVAVVDGRMPEAARLDAAGRIKPEALIGDYLALQLTEPLDILDVERSVITPWTWTNNGIGSIDECVFRIPPGGLPPIFTIAHNETRTFVSRETRVALMAAGIAGPAYISLAGYSDKFLSDAVDVAIPEPDPAA